MRAPVLARAAAGVLSLEAIALFVVAALELFSLSAGSAASATTAVALIVLTLIGAIALAGFAIGTLRGRSLARSGGVVLQVIAVVIALAALTLQPVAWTFVLGVGVPGLLGFILLIASARREAAGAD